MSAVTCRASRAACPRSPASLRPESTNSRFSSGSSSSTARARAGASSTTTWALVPLMPKALTPARRPPPAVTGQATGSWSSCSPLPSHSTWRLGVPACRVRGRVWWRSDCTTLISPATPEAACT